MTMRRRMSMGLGIFLLGLLGSGIPSSEGLEIAGLQNVQDTLAVSNQVARVTDAYWPQPQGNPEFILIQDVHRNPAVQSQISSLIIYGYEHWGVRKVFLEGAFTTLDLSVFHRVPKKTQSLLLERLIKDGDLSGPELATVILLEREWRDPPVSPFQLFGMEDPSLYRRNLLAYKSVINQRDRALQDLVPIRRLQDSLHLPQPNALEGQLDRTEALLRLKITPPEYDAYLQGKASVPSSPGLDPAIRAAEEFYRVVQLRSEVFLTHASRQVPASTAPRVLVVGGFHTAFMASRLRREGRSFVVLTPAVSAGGDDMPYERHLMETANVLSQALFPVPH
jgi:hypothetical protein